MSPLSNSKFIYIHTASKEDVPCGEPQEFFFGLLSSGVVRTVWYPFQTALAEKKVMTAVQREKEFKAGIFSYLERKWWLKAPEELWRGSWKSNRIIAGSNGFTFGSYELMRYKVLHVSRERDGQGWWSAANFVSGGAAGFLSRAMWHPVARATTFGESWAFLFSGFHLAATSAVLYRSLQLGIFDSARPFVPSSIDYLPTIVVLAAVSTGVAVTASYPFHRVIQLHARQSVQPKAGGSLPWGRGTAAVMNQLYRRGGMRTIFTGFQLYATRHIPINCVILAFVDWMRYFYKVWRYFGVPSR